MELLGDFKTLLRWFRAADLLSARDAAKLERQWGGSTQARHIVENVRELRERLRKEVLAWENGGTVHRSTAERLNELMASHPMLTRLITNRGASASELWFDARQPEHLLAPLAYSAAMLFATADRSRVRKCDQCVLHFHDASKKGTRRWCSMQLCGNRLKVAAYAARRRVQAHE